MINHGDWVVSDKKCNTLFRRMYFQYLLVIRTSPLFMEQGRFNFYVDNEKNCFPQKIFADSCYNLFLGFMDITVSCYM